MAPRSPCSGAKTAVTLEPCREKQIEITPAARIDAGLVGDQADAAVPDQMDAVCQQDFDAGAYSRSAPHRVPAPAAQLRQHTQSPRNTRDLCTSSTSAF